ncbi:MAG: TonB family protein [Acidobacteria bacterium]|uniref:TonB family protein n=1 Tax=Candidatus Polarisedimenticola svalbardensis TaxID=2886004 RepID=A0A8J6Y2S9_9BACT|nr:TonB family protein [Candidatus Polarisedimenticola svalbardensis]
MQNTVPHPLLAAPRSDGKFLRVAFLFALTVHVIVLLIPWKKEPYVPQPEPVIEGIVLTPYDIEPPQPEVRNIVEIEPRTRKVPLPSADPEPEMLEPLSEEVYVDQPVAYEGETDELLLDRPEPPAPGIYESWERDLVLPVRLASSADPEYPELGVVSRTGGMVILQAVVDETGRVVELEILRAPVPDVGFSQAALDAVAAWRYRPGTVNGRPVAVRMTVQVEFSLE